VRCVSTSVEDFIAAFLETYVYWIPLPERFEYPSIEAIVENLIIISIDRSVVRRVRAMMIGLRGCFTVKCLGTLRRAKRLALSIR